MVATMIEVKIKEKKNRFPFLIGMVATIEIHISLWLFLEFPFLIGMVATNAKSIISRAEACFHSS